MTADLTTLDTNILIYSIDRFEEARHKKAVKVVEEVTCSGNCVLTLQALSEFFYTATRKGKMPLPMARDRISEWMGVFPVVHAQPSVLQKAMSAVKEYQMAFWDAFLWATAKEAGIAKIITEDFQHEREIGGVVYINPFL